MPFSGPHFDAAFLKLIQIIKPTSMIDIGPGNGKYGKLMMANIPDCASEAVEIEASYVERFRLNDYYSLVSIARGIDVTRQAGAADFKWDLVVLGDVLEHMPKSEGIDLLHYFVYRAKWLWLRWPVRYIQGAYEEIEAEAHISIWAEHDVKALLSHYISMKQPEREAYIVQGYRERSQTEFDTLLSALPDLPGVGLSKNERITLQ